MIPASYLFRDVLDQAYGPAEPARFKGPRIPLIASAFSIAAVAAIAAGLPLPL